MLQKLSKVKVIDNTGVVYAKIIQLYSGRKTYAYLGNFIRITTRSIKKFKKTKKVKAHRARKIIFRKRRRMATIVRVKRFIPYIDGSLIRFRDNGVILYKKRKMLKGKRFYGMTTRCLGYEKLVKKFKMHI